MTKIHFTYIFTLALTLILVTKLCNSQHYFSSISHMKVLPLLQADILNQLESVVVQFRTDLRVINETSQRLREIKIKPRKNKIDLFVYINKLLKLKKYLTSTYKLMLDVSDLPTTEDLNGAVFSLTVLQSTYNLNINDICKGYIRQEFTELGLLNQLLLISSYYKAHDSHIHPVRALHESLHTINEKVSERYSYKDVQTNLGWVSISNIFKEVTGKLFVKHRNYVIKLFHYILWYLEKVSEKFRAIFIDVNEEFLTANLEEIVDAKVSLEDLEEECQNAPASSWNPYENEPYITLALKQYQHYSELCQGLHPPPMTHHLKCYLDYNGDFYHILNPFKIEQIAIDPLIVVYRNFVNEKEIEAFVEEATPWLTKSMIGKAGKSHDSIIRISHNAWLDSLPSELTALYRRIVSAVPLADESESLQVNNYGIGGLYTPHLDNRYQAANPNLHFDRLATFMIYLTDIDGSGATVFPFLNLTFFPERGAAIFWYNLYSNFSTDYRTLHAGCPVLSGDKWVVNKWYSNRNQLFRYPCKVEENVLRTEDVRRIYPHYDFPDEEA